MDSLSAAIGKEFALKGHSLTENNEICFVVDDAGARLQSGGTMP
jgi:hypothetical protein